MIDMFDKLSRDFETAKDETEKACLEAHRASCDHIRKEALWRTERTPLLVDYRLHNDGLLVWNIYLDGHILFQQGFKLNLFIWTQSHETVKDESAMVLEKHIMKYVDIAAQTYENPLEGLTSPDEWQRKIAKTIQEWKCTQT